MLRTSVYNLSQNEFVESVKRVFILRMGSLGQNGRPLRRDAVFAVARIDDHVLRVSSL